MVLTERPVREVVPIEHARMDNRTVLQWDKDDCAYMGLVKFDMLGLGMLASPQYCIDLVADRLDERWELHTIPKEEQGVYNQPYHVARGHLPVDICDDQPEPRRRETPSDRGPAVADSPGGGATEREAAPAVQRDPRSHQADPRRERHGHAGESARSPVKSGKSPSLVVVIFY